MRIRKNDPTKNDELQLLATSIKLAKKKEKQRRAQCRNRRKISLLIKKCYFLDEHGRKCTKKSEKGLCGEHKELSCAYCRSSPVMRCGQMRDDRTRCRVLICIRHGCKKCAPKKMGNKDSIPNRVKLLKNFFNKKGR